MSSAAVPWLSTVWGAGGTEGPLSCPSAGVCSWGGGTACAQAVDAHIAPAAVAHSRAMRLRRMVGTDFMSGPLLRPAVVRCDMRISFVGSVGRGGRSRCRWGRAMVGCARLAGCRYVGHDRAANHLIPSDRLLRRMLIALSFCAIGPQVNVNWLGRSGFVTNYGCSATASPFQDETMRLVLKITVSTRGFLQSIY